MNIPFQNGDKVYFIAHNEVYEGIVCNTFLAHDDPKCPQRVLLRTGKDWDEYTVTRANDVFHQLQPAMATACVYKERLLTQYKTGIRDVQDLIQFPLQHSLEHDPIARTAYLARAEELGFSPL
mgnify:CR=1 FL=1